MSAVLAAAIASSKIGDGCRPAEVRAAIAHADVRHLGSLAGDPVVLVSLTESCMCGNVNCPWLVVRAGRSAMALLVTYAFDVGVERASEVLPRLRDHAHDSALITDEDLYAYHAGRYESVAAFRVRGDTGARKPNTVPVRFGPGASSARLRGSVAAGWYDDYAFDAVRGQRVIVSAVTSNATPSLSIYDSVGGHSLELRSGSALTLPRSGRFVLHVDGAGERETPYALTFAIR